MNEEWKYLKRINDFYTYYKPISVDEKIFCDLYRIKDTDLYDAIVIHQKGDKSKDHECDKQLPLEEAKAWCMEMIKKLGQEAK